MLGQVILFCFLHVLNIFLCASVGQHHVKLLFSQSCLTLCSPTNYTPSLSTEFARQEYWSGLPFNSPGDLPNSGIEPRSPALQADSSPAEPPGKPKLGKAYVTAAYCSPAYLTHMQSTSCEMLGWRKHKLESRFLGII